MNKGVSVGHCDTPSIRGVYATEMVITYQVVAAMTDVVG